MHGYRYHVCPVALDEGYGSGNIDSDKRKFRRDRDKLLERGILIKEVRPAGAQETEESSWTIDREHTFAAGGLITADDADILLNAIDQTLAAGSSTFAAPLADIRSKIAYLTGRTTADEAPIQDIPLRPHRSRLASFEGLRHPCRLQSQRLSVL